MAAWRILILILAEALLPTGALVSGAPPEPPASRGPGATSEPVRPDSPEEDLWQQILALRAEPATTQPATAWFAAAADRRAALLEKTRLYLTLYPGGNHHAAVVATELATLFELGTLRGGTFGPLCARVQECLHRGSDDDPVVWEAAYWEILCQRLEHATTTQPTSAPVLTPDVRLLAAQRDYVARYPRSPHVPRVAALLFEEALKQGDQPEMGRLVAQLEQAFPEHMVTASLAARLRREQAVGSPFRLTFEQSDGTQVDTHELIGRPVLIVVWDSVDAAGLERVRDIERFRRTHPEFHVVGVNLDESRAQMEAAGAKLGLDWPQFNDGLGRANSFARQWGVRRLPCVFVVDRHGRLVGSTADADWPELATAALADDPP